MLHNALATIFGKIVSSKIISDFSASNSLLLQVVLLKIYITLYNAMNLALKTPLTKNPGCSKGELM